MITEDQMKMAAPRLVVVGVDGSPNSLAALRRAGHEARERGAGVLLVHVVPAQAHHGAVTRGYQMLEMATRREFPDGPAVPFACVVDSGDPAEALVERCVHAELLVIGGRVHSEHGNLLGGDVVPYCMRHARCPLVICADQRVTHPQPHRRATPTRPQTDPPMALRIPSGVRTVQRLAGGTACCEPPVAAARG